MGKPKFVYAPKTVYVTYIAAPAEKVWEALTTAAFTRQYFSGLSVEAEPRTGGAFVLRLPSGEVHIRGTVTAWEPPRKFAATWRIESHADMRKLPECLVTYEIEPVGAAVRLTMSEAHTWEVPDAILSGGRTGWPLILSSLKSLIETGKPIVVKMEPPKEMLEAIRRITA
jgi:uncharacterized protein YndB with AHSA1/START domain